MPVGCLEGHGPVGNIVGRASQHDDGIALARERAHDGRGVAEAGPDAVDAAGRDLGRARERADLGRVAFDDGWLPVVEQFCRGVSERQGERRRKGKTVSHAQTYPA
jgi:hypothetical protein